MYGVIPNGLGVLVRAKACFLVASWLMKGSKGSRMCTKATNASLSES